MSTLDLTAFILVCLGWSYGSGMLKDHFHIGVWGWICGCAATCLLGGGL